MKYPKIDTLWKRDKENKYVIMPGEYSKPEFHSIMNWTVTEKLDGQNFRIYIGYDEDEIEGNKVEYKGLFFQGRTKNTNFDEEVVERLKNVLDVKAIKSEFDKKTVLYGELVGDKVQKNGWKYVRKKDESPKNELVLFDAKIGNWWIKPKDVEKIAKEISMRSAPILGIWSRTEIIEHIKSKPKSELAKEDIASEGIVARSHPLMLFRDGKPIMFKLKVKDYEKMEEIE